MIDLRCDETPNTLLHPAGFIRSVQAMLAGALKTAVEQLAQRIAASSLIVICKSFPVEPRASFDPIGNVCERLG
jgi:hypothetical protein